MMEYTVVNINRRGEVFDPATITIHAGEIAGFEVALRNLCESVAAQNK